MLAASTRHALIACRYLVGAYYESRYVPAPEMAEHYRMNVRALMPALHRLTRAGILLSRVGGNAPGFILRCNPQQIQMFDVITALEGDARFACCRDVIPGIQCDCEDKNDCKIYNHIHYTISVAQEGLAAMSLKEYADTGQENKRIPMLKTANEVR